MPRRHLLCGHGGHGHRHLQGLRRRHVQLEPWRVGVRHVPGRILDDACVEDDNACVYLSRAGKRFPETQRQSSMRHLDEIAAYTDCLPEKNLQNLLQMSTGHLLAFEECKDALKTWKEDRECEDALETWKKDRATKCVAIPAMEGDEAFAFARGLLKHISTKIPSLDFSKAGFTRDTSKRPEEGRVCYDVWPIARLRFLDEKGDSAESNHVKCLLHMVGSREFQIMFV